VQIWHWKIHSAYINPTILANPFFESNMEVVSVSIGEVDSIGHRKKINWNEFNVGIKA
jgi:hypothetical protein